MKVYYSLDQLPDFKNAVLTIGSFDGVHSGHQRILERVKQLAQSVDSQSIVITFHPHPRLMLSPDAPPVSLLTTTDEKVALLEKYGVDSVVVVPFDRAFAEQTPDDYIENFLVKYFNPSHIVVGYDHRFGAKRVGDMTFLKKSATKFGYQVVEIEQQIVDEIAVSSTKIRQALANSDVKTANRLLGHPFIFSGIVVKGQQIGREIGFPTANLQIPDRNKLLPPHGIYAVFVYLEDGRKLRGMMYRGDRPVLKEHNNVTIEINIFDFHEDIYDKKMSVELIEFLRPDRNFDSLESLVVQLADDERTSRDALQSIENQIFPKVAIVILNWNTPQYLVQFLPSVCGSRYGNMAIFVADNGSTDNSVEAIRNFNLDGIPATMGIDRIRVIELKENHGFAKGYNVALQHEKLRPRSREHPDGYDYYVLLNSDCRVTQGWLSPIITTMQSDTAIAVAQPKILSYAKKRRFEYAGAAGGWMDSLGYPFARGRVFDTLEKDKKQYDAVEEIFWASGAAMVVRADIWHRFGGFDADFWAHMEEIDFCWRVKRAGYKVIAQPKGNIRHVGGGTMDYLSPKKAYLNFRNNLFLIFKNESALTLLWLLPLRLILDGVAAFKFLFDKKGAHFIAVLKAHFSFYGSLFSLIGKRIKTTQLIENERIAPPNKAGILKGSVVWKYFIKKQLTFTELIKNEKFVFPKHEQEHEAEDED
jgi:riboflavin kinase/FMN adenylyltransferase